MIIRYNESEQYIPLAKAAEHTPYSQEYLSLLVRKGRLHGKKMGRNWYTTYDDLTRYLNEQHERLLKKIPQPPETQQEYYAPAVSDMTVSISDAAESRKVHDPISEESAVLIDPRQVLTYHPILADLKKSNTLSDPRNSKRVLQAVGKKLLILIFAVIFFSTGLLANEMRQKIDGRRLVSAASKEVKKEALAAWSDSMYALATIDAGLGQNVLTAWSDARLHAQTVQKLSTDSTSAGMQAFSSRLHTLTDLALIPVRQFLPAAAAISSPNHLASIFDFLTSPFTRLTDSFAVTLC